jgi:ELWxxDGT repeat protein
LPDWGGWENGYVVDNNKLYFFADSSWSMGSITRLCVSDGTPGGTQAFKDVYPLNINTSRLGFLTAYNNKLYFSAAATSTGEIELWNSDGTAVGTQLFKNLVATTASSQPAQLTIFNGKLYMRVVDTSGRNELWESDGTDQGTKKVPYANADAKLSSITATSRNRGVLTRVGNSLFFLNHYGAKDVNAFYKIDQFPDLVNEVPAANTLDVYPNPVQSKLHFSRPVKNIFIYTTEGKVVYHAEKETQAIDIGGLPAATYFVSAEADDGMQLNKLIIKQ